VIVTPNEYLEAREPAWLDDEVLGRVRYDPERRVVTVSTAAVRVLVRLAEYRDRHVGHAV